MANRWLGRAAVALALTCASARAQLPPDAVSGELRLAGSSTVGRELAPDLLLAYGKQAGLAAVNMPPPDAEPQHLLLSAAEGTRRLRASVDAQDSAAAFPALAAGTADIGMASRRITADESAMMVRAGVGDPELPGNAYVVSLDGVVVLVNSNNAIGILTLDQIRRLFTGQINNWSALGGRDLPVTIYGRDGPSGAADTFRTLALHGDKLAGSARLLASSEALADSVAADEGGIGFAGFAYRRDAKPVTIALACGLTVEPQTFNVRSEEYPLARRLYFYTADKKSALVRDFLRFSLSAAAQPVVQRAGFINLLPELGEKGLGLPRAGLSEPGEAKRRSAALTGITQALAGARRLSTTFRFEADTVTLDTRAMADISRVAAWRRANPGGKLLLVGYASDQGTFDYSLVVSAKRAQSVASALAAAGAAPAQVLAGGTLKPVACDDDPSQAGLNRRVEVWVQ